MRLKILNYDLTVKYIPGRYLYIADTLSRAALKHGSEIETEFDYAIHALMKQLPISSNKLHQIQRATKEDITSTAKYTVLTKIHVAHQGIEKTTARARQVFYWPGINSEIENIIKSCRVCEKFSNKNRTEPLNVYELPERPRQRLSADIFSYGNHSFLVVMDAYSSWLEVVKIQSKSTEEVIRKCMSIFSKFGCPDTLVCDNIPFGSEKMKAFAREWNFNIAIRSPNYPRSNGLGEKAVGIAKKNIGLSPAQILFSRMCKTKLPVTAELLMPKIHPHVREKLKKRQEYGQKYYGQGPKQLKELEEGSNVIVYDHSSKSWSHGPIHSKHASPRSYIIENEEGNLIRRNRVDLKSSRNSPSIKAGIHSEPSDDSGNESVGIG
ncbi:Integrase zinc binding domain [Popillia japonica]|uniref:RNA-directed DNA polymerase n=1 Tax=Popillia japonica TaxID=7064 RepID=A0AAW1ICR0_POPJA